VIVDCDSCEVRCFESESQQLCLIQVFENTEELLLIIRGEFIDTRGQIVHREEDVGVNSCGEEEKLGDGGGRGEVSSSVKRSLPAGVEEVPEIFPSVMKLVMNLPSQPSLIHCRRRRSFRDRNVCNRYQMKLLYRPS
jgi:hypothetical protein